MLDEEEPQTAAGTNGSIRESTRSKFLQTLEQVVGLEPPQEPSEWKDEQKWIELLTEGSHLAYNTTFEEMCKRLSNCASAELFFPYFVKNGQRQMALNAGYSSNEAECLELLTSCAVRAAVGKAAKEGSSRYASVTHDIYNVIAKHVAGNEVAPKCYRHLTGYGGLALEDPVWKKIDQPDASGWMGMTCFAPLLLYPPKEEFYSPEGIGVMAGGTLSGLQVMNSTVVAFDFMAPEGQALHSALFSGAEGIHETYILPPLTSLEVVNIQDSFEYLPGKMINQKLVTVRPTFLLPAKKVHGQHGNQGSRFADDHSFLSFGTSEDAVRGMEDVTEKPVLTMEQEWARNDQWQNWNGTQFFAWEEFLYVTSPIVLSVQKTGQGVGRRDAGRDGWTPQQFVDAINKHIENMASTHRSRGTSTHRRESMTSHNQDVPQLSLQEVVAIRLYTGPGYTPINNFLREIAKLGAVWRKQLSHMPALTYSSTVGHLINGLRKIVRFNSQAQFCSVFRAVRGELPETFWLKNGHGKVDPTDFAFISTSVDEAVCKEFMDLTQLNVLFEMQCTSENYDGFNSGADLSLLSQWPMEKEMLFPPLTRLSVISEKEQLNEETTESGARFFRIKVTPHFF
jgi:hypothetical protein